MYKDRYSSTAHYPPLDTIKGVFKPEHELVAMPLYLQYLILHICF